MSHDHAHHGEGDHGDTTGIHGMLLFGEDILYLSHLPMFASPHNFQVLLEVRFDEVCERFSIPTAKAPAAKCTRSSRCHSRSPT